MKRTAIAIAVLLLTGCSDSGSTSSSAPAVSPVPTTQQPGTVTPLPTPATPPAATTAPHRVETSFFGVLGDQINETRDFVTRLWVMQWSWGGDIATQLAEIVKAGLPTTLDADRFLFVPGGRELLPDAREQLIGLQAKLIASGADRYVDSLTPCDEPNLKETDRSAAIPAAVALLRDVFPGKRLRCIYSLAYPLCSPELFDDIGGDDYRAGDILVLTGNDFEGNPTAPRMDAFVLKMRPDQGLILTPGGADLAYSSPTPRAWVEYAQVLAALGRSVEICAFAWRTPADQTNLRGICDQAKLRAGYEAAFKQVTA